MKKLYLLTLIMSLAMPVFAMFPPDYSNTPNTSSVKLNQSGFGNTNPSKKTSAFPQPNAQVPSYKPKEFGNTLSDSNSTSTNNVQYQEQNNKVDTTINQINAINNAIKPFIKY